MNGLSKNACPAVLNPFRTDVESSAYNPRGTGRSSRDDQQIDRAGMVVCKRQRLVAAFGHDEVVTGPLEHAPNE